MKISSTATENTVEWLGLERKARGNFLTGSTHYSSILEDGFLPLNIILRVSLPHVVLRRFQSPKRILIPIHLKTTPGKGDRDTWILFILRFAATDTSTIQINLKLYKLN